MDWSEFAAPTGGFSRTDPLLDVSLSFAQPLSASIVEWPKERDELQRRLHKSQKEATPFNYDTSPRIGSSADDPSVKTDTHGRIYIEEAFVDCWADWIIGGGWMDRDELTFKEANWALVRTWDTRRQLMTDRIQGQTLDYRPQGRLGTRSSGRPTDVRLVHTVRRASTCRKSTPQQTLFLLT